MKKLLILLVVLFTLTGCSKINRQIEEEKYNSYLTSYKAILEAENKLESSDFYNIELVVNQLNDEVYRYDIIIDEPRIAMYDIKALAVIDGIILDVDTENMMPSIGIMDDGNINMIPYQVNREMNYVEGIDLSLLSTSDKLNISVIVDWKINSKDKSYREYINLYGEFDPSSQIDLASDASEVKE